MTFLRANLVKRALLVYLALLAQRLDRFYLPSIIFWLDTHLCSSVFVNTVQLAASVVVYFHRAFQVTLAHRVKMALRDPRLVEWIWFHKMNHQASEMKWKFIYILFIYRESKGQEVCQVQEEHLDFRWVGVLILWKWAKDKGVFLFLTFSNNFLVRVMRDQLGQLDPLDSRWVLIG